MNDRGHFYWQFISFVLQFVKVPTILNDLETSFGEGSRLCSTSMIACAFVLMTTLCICIFNWPVRPACQLILLWLLMTVIAGQLWKMFTTSKNKRLNWCCHGCIKLHIFFFFFKCHCLKVKRKLVWPIRHVFLRVHMCSWWSLVLVFFKLFGFHRLSLKRLPIALETRTRCISIKAPSELNCETFWTARTVGLDSAASESLRTTELAVVARSVQKMFTWPLNGCLKNLLWWWV